MKKRNSLWQQHLPFFSRNPLVDRRSFGSIDREVKLPLLHALADLADLADLILDYCVVHRYDCLLQIVGYGAYHMRTSWVSGVEERVQTMLRCCEEMTALAPEQCKLDKCGEPSQDVLRDPRCSERIAQNGFLVFTSLWPGPSWGHPRPCVNELRNDSERKDLYTYLAHA